MTSPAQRHRARVLAAKANASSAPGEEQQGSAYELMMAQLAEHRRRLHSIQSVQQKIEVKKTILSEYDDWIDATLSAGTGAHDIVLTTVMVWCIDAGAYPRALQIGEYVLKHGLPMADQYKRTPAVLLIDEIAGAYLTGNLPAGVDATALLKATDTLTAAFDAPDQARAKLKKAIGYSLLNKVKTSESPELEKLSRAELVEIQTWLTTALQLDPYSGVKKDLERVERRFGTLQAEEN